MSNEFAYAVRLANRILERPNGDPDDDIAVLARQFLRAADRARDIPPREQSGEQSAAAESNRDDARVESREAEGH